MWIDSALKGAHKAEAALKLPSKSLLSCQKESFLIRGLRGGVDGPDLALHLSHFNGISFVALTGLTYGPVGPVRTYERGGRGSNSRYAKQGGMT